MTPRRRRLVLVLGILAGVSVAGALALSAFRQDVTFYFVPTQVALRASPPGGQQFRLGGMVEKGSVARQPGQHGGALHRNGLQAARFPSSIQACCPISSARARA